MSVPGSVKMFRMLPNNRHYSEGVTTLDIHISVETNTVNC